MQVELNESSLKAQAAAITTRLNELGVVMSNGKQLVVDLGFEALASLAGFRNQHAFRSALKTARKAKKNDSGRMTARKELLAQHGPAGYSQAKQTVDYIQLQRLALLQRNGYSFVESHAMDCIVVTHCQEELDQTYPTKAAAVANIWRDVLGIAIEHYKLSSDVVMALTDSSELDLVNGYLTQSQWSAELIPLLQEAGFKVQALDDTYNWVHEHEASDAFESIEQAWMDAVRYARCTNISLEPANRKTYQSYAQWLSKLNMARLQHECQHANIAEDRYQHVEVGKLQQMLRVWYRDQLYLVADKALEVVLDNELPEHLTVADSDGWSSADSARGHLFSKVIYLENAEHLDQPTTRGHFTVEVLDLDPVNPSLSF